jgi:hypothetical protein
MVGVYWVDILFWDMGYVEACYSNIKDLLNFVRSWFMAVYGHACTPVIFKNRNSQKSTAVLTSWGNPRVTFLFGSLDNRFAKSLGSG